MIGILGTLAGWLLNMLRDSMRKLQDADASLAIKVQSIEVLVAGQYVKRDDLEKSITAIFSKLDRIEGKIDLKADK